MGHRTAWRRVEARRREVEGRTLRFGDGRMVGRPRKDGVANRLAGMATCSVCGGGLVAERAAYTCWTARHKDACTNTARVQVDLVNEEVLRAVEEHALTPEAIEAVIALTERDGAARERDGVAAALRETEGRIARLVAAIEVGGDATSLTTRLRQMERKADELRRAIAPLRPVLRLAPRVLEDRLAEWRRLLRASVTQGRAVLQRIIQGRIVFSPTDDATGFRFEAQTRFAKLFCGAACQIPNWMPTGVTETGAEHIRREDTLDPDYATLLAQAEKRVATLVGFEPTISTLKGWRAGPLHHRVGIGRTR